MSLKEFNKFKKKTLKFKLKEISFLVETQRMFSLERMIDGLKERQPILKYLHDENDHRDKKDIYKRIIDRY
jgi:hypothetical protein